MDIAITGLPLSGKTTVFRALTGLGPGHGVGVVKLPDPRLESLGHLVNARKVTPAELRCHDLNLGVTQELGAALSAMDALMLVVRCFGAPDVPHPKGRVDPETDLGDIWAELVLADLALLEKRLERLDLSLKAARSPEREARRQERALLARIKDALDNNVPLAEQSFTPEAARALESYTFATARPCLILLNIGEEQIAEAQGLVSRLASRYARPSVRLASFCGKLELELAQLPSGDAVEFRAALGLEEGGRERLLRLCCEVLGVVSFFTVVSGEVRAWPVVAGTVTQKAAGKIHSDMERGFIRAEVLPWQELLAAGSLAEAKRRGLVRLEGKDYPVQDGDVLTVLFSR